MYGTGNKHGKTQMNLLTKKNPSDIWKFWNWCRRLSILPWWQVKLTTLTRNPIAAYFQSPQSWIPTEFLKIFDFQDLIFIIFQLLQAWGTTLPPALLAGSWVFTHKTESPRAQLASLAAKTPHFFCHYVGCQSRGLFVNENPGLVPDMFQASQNLIKTSIFLYFPSVSCAQYTRCHLLLSTLGSVSQLFCHTSAAQLIFFSPHLLSVSFSSYCSPRCPQVKSDLKPRSRVCWAYLSGKNNKSNEWLEKNNKQ